MWPIKVEGAFIIKSGENKLSRRTERSTGTGKSIGRVLYGARLIIIVCRDLAGGWLGDWEWEWCGGVLGYTGKCLSLSDTYA